MVYFGDNEKNEVTLTHSAKRKHAFWEEIKEISNFKKLHLERKLLLCLRIC